MIKMWLVESTMLFLDISGCGGARASKRGVLWGVMPTKEPICGVKWGAVPIDVE